MLAATRHAASLTGNSLNPSAVLSSSRRVGVHAHPASSSLVRSSNGGSSSAVVQTHPCCCSSQQHSRCCHLIPRAAGRGGRGGSSSSRRGSSGTSDGSSVWQDRLYSRGDDAGADAISGAPGRDYASNPRSRQPPGKQGGRGNSSSSRGAGRNSSSSRAADSGSSGSSDFVVIKKADAGGGAYIPTTQELQVQEETLDGAAYWDAALADFGEDEDDEGDDELGGEDEWEDGDGGEGEDEDVEVEEVISLLRELAAGLEDEAEEGSEEGSKAGEEGAAAGREELGPRVGGAAGVQWRQAYLGGATQPPLTLGPLCVKQAAGKGRGLCTTAAVQAGEVLLVCCPITLLYSEEGITPENEELAKHLAAVMAATAAAGSGSSGSSTGLAPWQQNALLQLRGPGDSSAASKQQQQQQQQQQEALPDLRQLLGPPDEPAQVHGSSSADTASHQQQQVQQQQVQQHQMQQLPDVDELTGLVLANCTGEEFEDPALVLLRGATSCGHLGVWPAAALINHACAPNCHAMLLGDRLVVRAARDIPAATELSLSYLGPQLFAPAAERQAELQQQWGFDCGCSRCKAEARYSSSSGGGSGSLSAALQHTYSRCQELSPQLDAAVDAEDLQAVRSVQQELLALQESVEGGIRAAKPPANVRRWLQASVYDLYDLLSLAADQLPPPPPKSAGRGGRGGRGGSRGRGSSGGRSAGGPAVETEALATCARIVGELTPGSSAHVELAVEYMVRTEARFGGGHQESDDASRLCAAAITTRYAPISRSMLQLLMDTWAGAALL